MPRGASSNAPALQLRYTRKNCPKCNGVLRMYGGRKKYVTLVLTDRVQAGILERLDCGTCEVLVGPHYYYSRDKEQRGRQDGSVTLDFHMLHVPECVFLMVDTSQTLFVQRRALEHLFVKVFYSGMSVAAAAQTWLMCTVLHPHSKGGEARDYQSCELQGQRASTAATVAAHSDLASSKGHWLQQALDLLMVLRAMEQQHQEWCYKQPGLGLWSPTQPLVLFVLVAELGVDKHQAGVGGNEEDVQQQQQQEEEEESAQDADMAEAADGVERQIPRGTLQDLLLCKVALLVITEHGDFAQQNHACCSLYISPHTPRALPGPCSPDIIPHQPQVTKLQELDDHVPVLLLDATVNLQLHACGVPGCMEVVRLGDSLWCGQHAPEHAQAGMQRRTCCPVATRSSAEAPWQACSGQLEPGSRFCSRHQGMQASSGPAADNEQQGMRAAWGATRHDKAYAALGSSSPGSVGVQPPATPGGAACTGPSSSNSIDAHEAAEECVFVGAKATRGVLAVTCAHCGACCGVSLLWSGQAETSPAGLEDMLAAVEPILRRCVPGTSQADDLPKALIIYNDAAAMVQYLRTAAPDSRRQCFSRVLWAVDTLRYLPTALRLGAEGQGVEDQQGPAAAAAAAAALPPPQPAAAAAATTAAAAAADEQQWDAAVTAMATPAEVSPFRQELQGILTKKIEVQHAQPWLQGVLDALGSMLPSEAQWRQLREEGTETDNRLLMLLQRRNFARLFPGMVSLWEVLKHALPHGTMHIRPQQRHRIFFRFTDRSSQPAATTCGSSSGDGAARNSPLEMSVFEVLVDSEAMERLWSQLQPGTTISLKTQVHALAQLKARLDLHNMMNALEVATMRDWIGSHFQDGSEKRWDGTDPLPTRTQLRERHQLMGKLQMQLAGAPLLQQQCEPYTGLAIAAGYY